MLCFRCEHRARFLEEESRPRCECGDIRASKSGCYMFLPCRIPVWEPDKNKNDPRPIGTGMLARRAYAKRLGEGKLKFRKLRDGEYISYWTRIK